MPVYECEHCSPQLRRRHLDRGAEREQRTCFRCTDSDMDPLLLGDEQ